MEQLSEIIRKTDRRLIEDPFAQAAFFARQAYKHFEENRDLVLTLCRGAEHYPSLILQKMICTVRHENAYAGVISSRDTQTGVGMELQTAHNIFGEEMMTGTAEIQSTSFEDREAIKDTFPAVYHFVPHLGDLEREFESPVTIEFAVEATRRYQWFALLQLNETGMAGRAALTSVVDLHKSGAISRKRVTELIRPYHIKQLTSDTIDQEDFKHAHQLLLRRGGSAQIGSVGPRLFHGRGRLESEERRGEGVPLQEDLCAHRHGGDARGGRNPQPDLGRHPRGHDLPEHGYSRPPEPGEERRNAAARRRPGEFLRKGNQGRGLDHYFVAAEDDLRGKSKVQACPALALHERRAGRDSTRKRRKAFASIAYAYRYYQQLIRGLTVEQDLHPQRSHSAGELRTARGVRRGEAARERLVRRPRNVCTWKRF